MHDIAGGALDSASDGDIVIVISGRNADEASFRQWIDVESV
ncbi:MAG: hypothetical protein ACK55I_36005 [bacterium]